MEAAEIEILREIAGGGQGLQIRELLVLLPKGGGLQLCLTLKTLEGQGFLERTGTYIKDGNGFIPAERFVLTAAGRSALEVIKAR